MAWLPRCPNICAWFALLACPFYACTSFVHGATKPFFWASAATAFISAIAAARSDAPNTPLPATSTSQPAAHTARVGSFGSLDIALARKAREYAHGQHHVELRDVRPDELDIVIGLHGDGGLAAGVMNHFDRQIKLAGIGVECLGMHRDDVGRMLQIPGKLFERVGNHQVHVERQLRDLLQAGNKRHAERKIRHKMTVHDIDMHEGGTAFFDFGHITGHIHEVGGQN